MRILITGFDPFGGETVNPAWEAVKALPDTVSGAELITAQIPTEFGRSAAVLRDLIAQHQPQAVVCVGQAGGRSGLSVERVAINIDTARIPDNAGVQPLNEPIVDAGPAAYFSTLPINAMVQASHAAGVPATVSNSAGTFVCNHIMYQALHMLAGSSARAGFVHVPYAPAQTLMLPETASMPTATVTAGLTAMLAAIAANKEDTAANFGALH